MGTLLKNQIPIRTGFWDISVPGFMEADTVAHCGHSLAGDFVWSLTLTDILTGWTECWATWNKGSTGIINQFKAIERALPFTIEYKSLAYQPPHLTGLRFDRHVSPVVSNTR